MVGTLREVLAGRASENLVGRTHEIAALLECLEEGGPLVAHIHGIAGVGKSTLLEAFSSQAAARGVVLVKLDCRLVEPTPHGFTSELGNAINSPVRTAEEAADRLGRLGSRVVLIVDGYELFRLLDTWIRQTFIPALSHTVRIVMSGRQPPLPSWLTAPEWQGLFRNIQLDPLTDTESLELLARAGVKGTEAQRINRFARGHPLALRLAVSAIVQHPELDLEQLAAQSVVQHLTDLYLADVKDPAARLGIEAASVTRRITQPLLGAMLPDAAPQEVYERLSALSFVERSRDGLIIHDAVREAVATSLRCSDPARYRGYRRAAWRLLHAELPSGNRDETWRYTADMLYLLENPFVREAFFPGGSQEVAVEPATQKDGAAILDIACKHESPAAANLLAVWWYHAPQFFHVTRDSRGAVVGFYLLLELGDAPPALIAQDPLARGWSQHIRDSFIPKKQTAVYLRRWLSLDRGELPSPIQGACWLDVKRTYMNLRPYLRRCYLSVCDLQTYGPTAQKLGFKIIPEATVSLDGVSHHLAMLDFGPGSIDGWLSGLVAKELGLEQNGLVDVEARELVIAGKRIGLTGLEFGVLRHLQERDGKAVTRADLLEDVWGQKFNGGSNVVDVVVRSLRKKLGDQASRIDTVRGVGYRFRNL